MNCFMGYNPLASKQVKVTVWVNEQDGAVPVAPINPSEGDCFIVYATDEAMLSNTPTSKKTYTNGDWADAEGGGGGGGDFDYPSFTMNEDTEPITFSCDKTYAECVAMCTNDITDGDWFFVMHDVYDGNTDKYLGFYQYVADPDNPYVLGMYRDGGIVYYSDGTITDELPQ